MDSYYTKYYFEEEFEKMREGIVCKVVVFTLVVMFVGTIVSAVNGQFLMKQELSSDSSFIQMLSGLRERFTQQQDNVQDTREGYDFLIIAPNLFATELQKLVDHKNRLGVRTTLIRTEDIYQKYTGELYKDNAEKIKYCIKDEYNQSMIKYVMLVGGLKGYFSDPNYEDNWYVPARYSNLDLDGYPEPRYLSDLYFADIYWENTTDFCDWNSNDNEVFGEWRWEGGQEIKDERDLVPEVSIGRLPCRNLREVQIMVRKIINYESSNHTSEDWFLRFLMLGGENANDTSPDGVIEGKYANQLAYNWSLKRHPFIPIGLWPCEEDITKTTLTKENFVKEQNLGSGFTYLSGHGDPGSWFAHQYYTGFHDWMFIRFFDLLKLRNKDRLPVAVVGGCNTACFDKPLREATTYLSFDSFSWIYTRWILGGSIATLANTNIGYSLPGTDFTTAYGGFLQTYFFEVYGNGTDEQLLGDIWKQQIIDYVHRFDAREDMLHCKIAESWVLLGDPSLRIGGY
jgi:hypothetical protein